MGQPLTLSKIHESNNFDLLRLAAALIVFCSHAFPIYNIDEIELLHRKILPPVHVSTIGASIFFAISGYLITRSFILNQNIKSFCIKRIARLYPAFTINLLISLFIFGPLLSSLDLNEYFKALQDIIPKMKFFLFDFYIPNLPGVFKEHEGSYFYCFNVPLWTLKIELFCYFIVIAAGIAGLLKARWYMYYVVILLFLSCVSPELYFVHFVTFVTGGGLFIYKDKINFSRCYILTAIALLLAVFALNVHLFPVYICLICYITIGLGLRRWKISDVTRKGDISYGFYIYAAPIQIAVAEAFNKEHDYFIYYFIISLLLTALCGTLSWKFIEEPILNKVRLNKNKISNA